MRIPFCYFKSSVDHPQESNRPLSNISYLELYTAVHNCRGLKEEQVLELQWLLAEKLEAKRQSKMYQPTVD